jgi:hypothetical protein
MANLNTKPIHNLREISQALFDAAKYWRIAELSLRISVFAVGGVVVFLSILPKYAPFLIAFLSIIAELCHLRSNANKGLAESILRKLDVWESFGWPISGMELSDILMQCPARLRKIHPADHEHRQYFFSQQTFGPKRALENAQESAWWSKHLAMRTGHFYLATTIVLVFISLGALLVSIETIHNFDVLSNIGRVVTSTFMLIFSLGLIRFIFGYYQFSSQASRVETQAARLLELDSVNQDQAIKLIYEYQLSRAVAPLLPSWLWKLLRNDLNSLWQEYRRVTPKGIENDI